MSLHRFLLLVFLCAALTATAQVNPRPAAASGDIAITEDLKSMAAYTGTKQLLFVKDSLRGGLFAPYTGPLPADEGMIIKDATGNKWRRYVTDGRIRPEWYGAGATLADNYEPFMKAIAYIYATGNANNNSTPFYANAVLYLSGTWYNFKKTLVITRHISIEGQGTRYEPTSILHFPANIPGLKLVESEATGDYSVDIKNVWVRMDRGTDSTAHGISIACVVNFENVAVSEASGDGIHIDACSDHGAKNYGKADASVFTNCKVSFCNNGVYINGCDANHMVFQSFWAMTNRRWGIYDNGFLGNHYYNPQCDMNGGAESIVSYGNPVKSYLAVHTEDMVNINQPPSAPNSPYWREIPPRGGKPWAPNKRYYTGGAYAIVNPNAFSTVIGAYTEEGEAPALLNNRTVAINGDQGSGVVGGSYMHAINEGLLLTSNLVMTGKNKIGIGTSPYSTLDVNYNYKDEALPYIARFRCDDCPSTNLLFANSSSDFGVIGYDRKSFITLVDHKVVTFTDASGIMPFAGQAFDLGSADRPWRTIYAANWRGGTIQPAYGGTGLTAITPFGLLAGGNQPGAGLQQINATGNAGQVLTSNGAGALPSWQSQPATASPAKMSTQQRNAISNPTEGLMIYNLTTHKLNVFTGKGWEQVNSN